MFDINEIESALDRHEFFLEYIPTISLADDRCVGGEALIRWRRGSEIIPPLDFIPLVENTPLSGAVTYWVMDTVSAELRSWLLGQGEVRISINVPPEIFGRGGLRYAARKSGLCDVADKLVLEVTERGLLDKLGVAGIDRVSGSKVLVALDDIGMNDASLLVLSRVPADIVKMEKSYVEEMLRGDWHPRQIAGLSALVKSGNLRVIAEGVENAAQAKILKDAGIQMAQGWYFSPPLSAPDFMAYFSRHQ